MTFIKMFEDFNGSIVSNIDSDEYYNFPFSHSIFNNTEIQKIKNLDNLGGRYFRVNVGKSNSFIKLDIKDISKKMNIMWFTVLIRKYEDDWFTLMVEDVLKNSKFYKCDSFDGLIKCINELKFQ